MENPKTNMVLLLGLEIMNTFDIKGAGLRRQFPYLGAYFKDDYGNTLVNFCWDYARNPDYLFSISDGKWIQMPWGEYKKFVRVFRNCGTANLSNIQVGWGPTCVGTDLKLQVQVISKGNEKYQVIYSLKD